MTLPAQNKEYVFYTALISQADPATFQIDPTIATGDFKISIDGSALNNLTTLPTVSPAGSSQVKIELSATEMASSKVSITAIDAAGSQWEEAFVFIDVPTGSAESLYDIEVGDVIETSARIIVNKVGTTTPLLDKAITGSLLSSSVAIGTTDTV